MSFSVENFTRTLSDHFTVLYQNRYCDQEDFSVAVFGGGCSNKNIRYKRPFLLNNFDTKVYLPSLLKHHYACKVVASGSDIYVTYNFEVSDSHSVKLYSSSTNSWKYLPSVIEQTINYCICSFMQKLFVIGGRDTYDKFDRKDTCMFYDKQSGSWTTIEAMMECRENEACTVFEGKIVVSGGTKTIQVSLRLLRNPPIIRQTDKDKTVSSVEAYDYHENKWSSFPSMLTPRENHTAVSISNKMFVIGGSDVTFVGSTFSNSEVFDSATRKFTNIKNAPKWIEHISPYQTVSFGYNIYCFVRQDDNEVNVHSYDVKKDLFCYKTSVSIENTANVRSTRVPMV